MAFSFRGNIWVYPDLDIPEALEEISEMEWQQLEELLKQMEEEDE